MQSKCYLRLSRYVERQVKRNSLVDTKEIMETAKEIYCGVAKKLNVNSQLVFLTSNGRVDKFTARHNVKNVIRSGEAVSVDRQEERVYPE